MSQYGLGAMIHMLGGGSAHDPSEYIGMKVKGASLDAEADRVVIEFEGGKVIHIWDDGQSCCEHRYITCDDDLAKLVGGAFLGLAVKLADEEDEWGDCHEQAFVDLKTSVGTATFTTHNEHNGYYGGFGLTITEPTHDQ